MNTTTTNAANVLPLSQQDTILSKQRQKFLAKQRQQHEDNDMVHETTDYDFTIERLRRHTRKNISSKDSPIRPRRQSKHDVTKHIGSVSQRRPSMRNHRSQSTMIFAADELEWLAASNSGSSSGSECNRRKSPRRRERRGRRRSIAVTSNVPTPSNSPKTRRPSLLSSGVRTDQELVTTLNAKFSLNW